MDADQALEFCEVCGSAGVEGSSTPPAGVRELASCSRCDLLACDDCRNAAGCAACSPVVVFRTPTGARTNPTPHARSAVDDGSGTGAGAPPTIGTGRGAPPTISAGAGREWLPDAGRRGSATHALLGRSRARLDRKALVAAGALGVAVVLLAVSAPYLGSPAPAGGVLGERGLPSQAAPARGSGQSGGGGATGAANVIVESHAAAPVWQDVLGAWRGQALFAVRNEGAEAMEISLADSGFSVRDGEEDVAAGRFEAAVPPILEPGATGYLVGRFTLPAAPSGPLAATSRLAAVVPADRLVTLVLDDVQVGGSAGTVAATGTVRNPGDGRVEGGSVAVVLLSDDGRPLAAVLDAASAAVLEEGEVAEFDATYPATPSPERGSVARAVAMGWAWDRRVARP